MSNDGSDVSICISKSDAFGKIVFKSPNIGDIANPGSDVTADTDQIATSDHKAIVPLPVFIFIVAVVYSATVATIMPNKNRPPRMRRSAL